MLDFRDPDEVALADSLANLETDSLNVQENTVVADNNLAEEKAKKFEQNYTKTKVELDKTNNELSRKEKELENLKKQLESKNTAEHEKWLKSTIKLYEAMETNKAGKLLSALPENEAREIIYSMKNKKAAAILSSLSTDIVKRLTRQKK